ncbi:MAG: polysaccharide biosynthesis protein [Candidatus Edwardsbacteria bacterium]|jgi:FlaA1/EpsC-like NDP-sugar epimerase|nr:polysaccharide biosynthesis protein [Candidatus Edwardsbacteria bacterium]
MPEHKLIERNRWWMLAVDAALLTAALVGAFWLRFDLTIPAYYRAYFWQMVLSVVGLRLALLVAAGVYRGVWRYLGVGDLVAIARAISIGSLLIASASFLLRRLGVRSIVSVEWLEGYPVTVLVGEWLGDIILIGGFRLFLRLSKQYRTSIRYRGAERKRVLLVGAGDAGEMVARQLLAHPEYGYQPAAFIDDDPAKRGRQIHGVTIHGGRAEIGAVAARLRIDEIIIAIPSAPGTVVREVVERCKQTRVRFKIVPGIKEIIEGGVSLSQIREVELDDLLRRAPVSADLASISGYLRGRTVLITGAGGSIGSELCRQIAGYGPRSLVLVGRGENSIYEMDVELRRAFPGLRYALAIGDVTDRGRMERIFAAHRPDAVFHAAAHKHVPMMEHNPGEAVKNNVLGTRTVAELALRHRAGRFVMISTDKAVNPTSVMGATKRMAEEVVRGMGGRGRTKFIVVRFGNVLGSRGSVVPLFKRQIAQGGPVTVTHPEVERYFMTIPEAVQLVIQAGAMGRGGEVFVLDMGKPVRIVDLARDLIALSGLEPDRDIRIEFTGLRPGEKLYEELFTAEEGMNATRNAQIFKARTRQADPAAIARGVDRLVRAAAAGDDRAVVAQLARCLPTFKPDADAGQR